MAFENDPEPVVGGTFNGTLIKSIKIEESKKGLKSKKRFIMTLENGIIAIEDRFVSAPPPHSDISEFAIPYNEIPFPKLPNAAELAALQRQREKEDREERKRQKEAERIRKEEEWRRRQEEAEREEEAERQRLKALKDEAERQRLRALEEEAERQRLKAEAERRRLKELEEEAERQRLKELEEEAERRRLKELEEEAERLRLEEEEEAKRRKKRVSFGPTRIQVLPEDDPDLPESPTKDDPRAIWKFPYEDDKPEDADFWKPHEIVVFAPGDDPTNYSNGEDPSVDDSLSLSGVWGYVPGTEPAGALLDSDGTVGSLSNDDSSPFFPSDIWVYPPGTTPPEDFPKHGVYIMSPKALQQDWPPEVDETKKELARVGRLNLPATFVGNDNAKPLPLRVYPKTWQKPKGGGEGGDDLYDGGAKPIVGEWTYPHGDEQDDDDWAPQDAIMYPPGHSIPSPHRHLPQGIWATTENLDPYDEDGNWSPPNIMVFPPGTDLNDIKESGEFGNVVATGTWCFPPGALKKDWPPPTNDEVRRLRNVGRLQIPPIFQGNVKDPISITVYSRWQKPIRDRNSKDDDVQKPVGRWSYPRGEEEGDDEDWEPQEVLLYAPGQKPSSDLTLHEKWTLPKGIWTISADEPDVVKVYPPGMIPDDDELDYDNVIAQGEWTYPVGALKRDWPPPTKEEASRLRSVGKLPKWCPPGQPKNWRPQDAQVFPKRGLPSSLPLTNGGRRKGDKPRGVWKYEVDDEPEDLDDWETQDVIMYPADNDPDVANGQPSGFWGLYKDATPDDDGNWDPSDIWFYPPGVTPGDDCAVQGKWAFHPGRLNVDWPPLTKQAAKRVRMIGKAPKWNPSGQGDNWKPQSAIVHPKRSAPRSSSGQNPNGVWQYQHGKEPTGLDDWNAQEVMIYPKGLEPENLAEKPHGVWGICNDAEPDEDTGEWKPDDIWFYGPGEEPDEDCAIQGKWTFPPSQLDVEWPPKSDAFVSPKRNVGKLQIPNMFSNPSPKPPAAFPTTARKPKSSHSPKSSSHHSPPRPVSQSSAHSSGSSSQGKRDMAPISPLRQKSELNGTNDDDGTKGPISPSRAPMSLYQSAFEYTPTKQKAKRGK